MPIGANLPRKNGCGNLGNPIFGDVFLFCFHFLKRVSFDLDGGWDRKKKHSWKVSVGRNK